jgi:hypothetical protein
MIKQPTKTITTPQSNIEVVIKEWITGEDRQYINGSLMQAVKVKPKLVPGVAPEIENFDMDKYTTLNDNREIERFVVSVDGNTENVVQVILSLPEDDTQFVKDSIQELSKKKEIAKA